MTFAVLQHMLIAGGENVPEKTITIRVTDEEHRNIKLEATKQGITIKDYVLELVKKDLEKDKKK